MKTTATTLTLILTLIVLIGCSHERSNGTGSMIEKKVTTSKKTQEVEEFVWYDGSTQRKIRTQPNLLVEFKEPGDKQSQVKDLYPEAVDVSPESTGVKIWQLDASTVADATTRIKNDAPGSMVSPLFQASGQRRALPGNIVVHFNPNWNEAQIKEWITKQGLEIDSKASFGTNIYVISSEPGLESLQVANRLYETGEVAAASPNWWVEVKHR